MIKHKDGSGEGHNTIIVLHAKQGGQRGKNLILGNATPVWSIHINLYLTNSSYLIL